MLAEKGRYESWTALVVTFLIVLLVSVHFREIHGFSPPAYNNQPPTTAHGLHRRNIHYRVVPTSSVGVDIDVDEEEKRIATTRTIVMPDYLIVDSSLDDDINNDDGGGGRPNVVTFLLLKPRNILATTLLLDGLSITTLNVMGNFGDMYLKLTIGGVLLGVANGIVDMIDSQPPYINNVPTDDVSPNVRTGVVDDALLHVYSSVYTISACWLSVRTSLVCPDWLPSLDDVFGLVALTIFAFSLVAPVLTLIHDNAVGGERRRLEDNNDDTHETLSSQPLRMMVGTARRIQNLDDIQLPALSETEFLRARGLLAIGIVACVYIPEVLSFLFLGQDWWIRVVSTYPGQAWAESSYALFGVLATQASMVAHRAGKAGVAPFRVVVPVFAGVCILLTVLPCISTFYWWGEKISFFEFYSL